MKKILIAVLAVIILIAGTGALVLYMVGDRIISQAIDIEIARLEQELEKDLEGELATKLEKELGPSFETAPEVPQDESGQPPEISSADAPPSNNKTSKTPAKEVKASGDKAAGDTAAKASEAKDKPAGAPIKPKDGSSQPPPISGNIAAENKPSTKKPEPQITIEKMAEIKGEVTAVDKMTAAALVLKRLSGKDIEILKSMLSGGISAQEMSAAKQMVYDKFTDEEVRLIKEIYRKYMK